jgi:hypothetical protein
VLYGILLFAPAPSPAPRFWCRLSHMFSDKTIEYRKHSATTLAKCRRLGRTRTVGILRRRCKLLARYQYERGQPTTLSTSAGSPIWTGRVNAGYMIEPGESKLTTKPYICAQSSLQQNDLPVRLGV